MSLYRGRDKITKKQEACMADVPYVSEQNFQKEVLDSSLPVLVDFTAVWCGPCKMVAPIVEQLSTEWAGKVKVVKCDADQNPNVLTKYGIMGIPTLMMFKSGKVAERVTGFQPKEKLVSKLSPHI
jgi:thioredoxin 1